MTRYYEDLSVGDAERRGEYRMERSDIVAFAERYDPQSFHLDEEAAADSIFGGLVASGLHTLCASVRLFIDEFVSGSDGIANMGGLGMDDLRWHEPVRPGDRLSLRVEVTEKRPSTSHDDRGYVTLDRTVLSQTEATVLSLVSYNIVQRRPD